MNNCINEKDIGKMLKLGDEVLEAMDMNSMKYDENGVFLLNKYPGGFMDSEEWNNNMKDINAITFLQKLYNDDRIDLDKALSMDCDEVMELLPEPLLKKAVGIFRNGAPEGYTGYTVSPGVSDRYLEELFAMKVREMLIHHASLRD